MPYETNKFSKIWEKRITIIRGLMLLILKTRVDFSFITYLASITSIKRLQLHMIRFVGFKSKSFSDHVTYYEKSFIFLLDIIAFIWK
jgi:hypothetical protein